jgi:enoyl-CoA hydratase/carnithine racemase
MTYQNIVVEAKGRVGIIRLNRPQALNALNKALIDELTKVVDAFDADDKIGCMLITGNEKAFAAGADIKEMADKPFIEAYLGDFVSNWNAVAQAGHRRGRRLRARRRLRAGDAIRYRHCRRHGQVRSAGDQARRDPGHWRHAAACARGR